MADELPAKMTISGFAINTAGPGNGLWFNHDQMAEVVGQKAHFVADHDTGIGAIAGTVEFTDVQRKRIFVDRVEPDEETLAKKGKRKAETATRLAFRADLADTFNGYEKVARNIIALREAKRVPNVSVFVYGSAITYESDTDRFFLEGPYSMRHLGQVDLGAFSDEVGVGVYDVQMEGAEAQEAKMAPAYMAAFAKDGSLYEGLGDTRMMMASGSEGEYVDVGVSCSMGVSVCLANQGDLVAKFIDEHGLDSPLVEKLGKRLGFDEPRPETDEATIPMGYPGVTVTASSGDTGTAVPGTVDIGAHYTGGGTWGSGSTGLSTYDLTNPFPASSGFITLKNDEDEEAPEGSSKSSDSSETNGSSEPEQEDNHMSDEQTTTQDTPESQAAAGGAPAPEPAKVGLSEEQVKELLNQELAARDERIATLEKENKAAKEAVLTETRKRITDKFGLDEDEQAALNDMPKEALSVFEKRLEAASLKGNAIPLGLFERTAEDDKSEAVAKKMDEAKEWHKKRYLGAEVN